MTDIAQNRSIRARVVSKLPAVGLNLVMLIFSLTWMTPLWMMTVYATQPQSAIFAADITFLHGGELLNNVAALQKDQNFFRAILNSVLVAGIATSLTLLISSMAGYALARFEFRGRKLAFAAIITILAVPPAAIVIPEYIIVVKHLGLSNRYSGVILPYLASALGVFFMRQIFLSFPKEIIEAALMEGASELRVFFVIVLPVVRPALASLGIILFLATWNDYLWPLLILSSPDMQTAPIALGRMIGLLRIEWGAMMAGVTLMTLPFVVLFLFLQRQVISGITNGAIK